MILKKNKARVSLPEPFERGTETLRIFIPGNPVRHPRAIAYLVNPVPLQELNEKDFRRLGRPVLYAVTRGVDPGIMLWPKPDKNYFAQFRYCPAMREI